MNLSELSFDMCLVALSFLMQLEQVSLDRVLEEFDGRSSISYSKSCELRSILLKSSIFFKIVKHGLLHLACSESLSSNLVCTLDIQNSVRVLPELVSSNKILETLRPSVTDFQVGLRAPPAPVGRPSSHEGTRTVHKSYTWNIFHCLSVGVGVGL